jgi:hypothetical protein
MFNTFNNANNVNPLSTPALFNFDGFLRQGVGDHPFDEHLLRKIDEIAQIAAGRVEVVDEDGEVPFRCPAWTGCRSPLIPVERQPA